MTDKQDQWEKERQKIIGFGPQSLRKSYYPELRTNLQQLQRFRALLDQNSEGFLVIDAQTRKILDLNPATCDLVKAPAESILGTTLEDIIPEADAIIRLGDTACNRLQMVSIFPPGEPSFSAEMNMRYVQFQSTGYYLISLRDVRELINTLVAARESQENLRTIFENFMDAIIVHKHSGQIVAINERTTLMFGIKKDEASLYTIKDVTMPEADRDVEAMIRGNIVALQKNDNLVFEWRGRNTVTGAELDLEVSLRECRWFGEKAVISFIRDIHNRKVAAQEQSKIEERLRQSQKMESIGRMAGGVAHDFNNFLTIILGYTEILLMRYSEDQESAVFLHEMLDAVNSSKKLTKQLLVFSRSQPLRLDLLNFNDVVGSFAKILKRTLRENIELTYVPNPDLPLVKADSGQIEQVLLNLAINAQDAMPDGGTLTLRTEITQVDHDISPMHLDIKEGDYIRLDVTDSGTGMDKETQGHIFEPFFTTKEVGKGTGLGLATVYGIITQHEGYVQVYSEPGHGTTFRLYFPTYQETVESVHPETARTPMRGQGNIMLVEDNEVVRLATEKMLKELGYTVYTPLQQDDCLPILQSTVIDLIISDVIMPRESGPELVERLKLHYPQVKVLFMSGYTGDAMDMEYLDSLGQGFLQKPFNLYELAEKIAGIIHN